MDRAELAEALIASAAPLRPAGAVAGWRKREAEGGCGVVGVAASVPVPGKALLQPLSQMRNRGNGKGGGIAAAGLDPAWLGVTGEVLADRYLLAIAYLDPAARTDVEAQFVTPLFEVDEAIELPARADQAPDPAIRHPDVAVYPVRVREEARERFAAEAGIGAEHGEAIDDELVYQNSVRLNAAFYSSTGEKRAFVLSHGKDLLVLKLVAHGDDVIRVYGLEDLAAHVWIGHHRYPTKGRVWHPGGAHPFVGLHEALVHNGDFANYASICAHLAQRNRYPHFLTDTEVAALLFDLLHRTYGYPLEYVIEALAPTTERDFALLPADKQRIYRLLQANHLRGSPDGPWYFLIAQSVAQAARRERELRLIGITDTSMLRPQVFALQSGEATVGVAASEKQAIDALLESLSREDPRFWPRADRYWSARGGSHTDGGAFVFSVRRTDAGATVVAHDKFGRAIEADAGRMRVATNGSKVRPAALPDGDAEVVVASITTALASGDADGVRGSLAAVVASGRGSDADRDRALAVLAALSDRRYPVRPLKRSAFLSLVDEAVLGVVDAVRRRPSARFRWAGAGKSVTRRGDPAAVTLVIDARDLPAEGQGSPAARLVAAHHQGFRRFVVAGAHGHRFIGSGLGPATNGTRIEVFGSSGDYLGSGIDGAELVVHGSGQDQLAQILKAGTLVVHGDVGQTFMYAAKGGDVFVRGNAAGRPLINAVGRPRVVINGTCLDYLAESFMAGDPLNGGGFVILNGIGLDEDGEIVELPEPYPGGNLFSLASGGAIYLRDPRGTVGEEQLNGGGFARLTDGDWAAILPYLVRNERLFGIEVDRLLTVSGRQRKPAEVYRVIRPAAHAALTPEEAWVRPEG
jgi:glutamate synthase domain-containing protein 1/glutamate synthase domain-containing protein 3